MRLTGSFLFLSVLPSFGLALICLHCQTGYTTSEVCSNQLEGGFAMECDDPDSQCFESIQWFNDGALRLAVRGCWTAPSNSTVGGFCDNYDNVRGDLKYCRNCTEDMCNTDALYFPQNLLTCHT